MSVRVFAAAAAGCIAIATLTGATSAASAETPGVREAVVTAAELTYEEWVKGGSSRIDFRTVETDDTDTTFVVHGLFGERARSFFYQDAGDSYFQGVQTYMWGPAYTSRDKIVTSLSTIVPRVPGYSPYREPNRHGRQQLKRAGIDPSGFVDVSYKTLSRWPASDISMPISSRHTANQIATEIVKGSGNPGATALEWIDATESTITAEAIGDDTVYKGSSEFVGDWTITVGPAGTITTLSELSRGTSSLTYEGTITIRYIGPDIPQPIPVASVSGTRVQKVLSKGVFRQQESADIINSYSALFPAMTSTPPTAKGIRAAAKDLGFTDGVNIPGGVCVSEDTRWGVAGMKVTAKKGDFHYEGVGPRGCRP